MDVVQSVEKSLHNFRSLFFLVQGLVKVLDLVLFKTQLVLPEFKRVVELTEQVCVQRWPSLPSRIAVTVVSVGRVNF